MNLSVKFVLNLLMVFSMNVLVSSRWHRHNHERVCRDPSPSKIDHQRSSSLLYTFYQMPTLLNAITFESVPAQFKRVNHFRIKGAKKCPSFDGSLLLHNGDVCPVFYVLNVDRNRIPHTFIESVCLCDLSVNADSPFTCKQQMIYARVQRRTGCSNGVYVYSELWEPIRMGCTATVSGITSGAHTKNRDQTDSITEESPKDQSRRNKSPKSPRRPSRPETPKSPRGAVGSHKWNTPKSPRDILERPQSPKSPSNLEASKRSRTPKSPRNYLDFEESPKSPENREI